MRWGQRQERLDEFLTKVGIAQWQLLLIQAAHRRR